MRRFTGEMTQTVSVLVVAAIVATLLFRADVQQMRMHTFSRILFSSSAQILSDKSNNIHYM